MADKDNVLIPITPISPRLRRYRVPQGENGEAVEKEYMEGWCSGRKSLVQPEGNTVVAASEFDKFLTENRAEGTHEPTEFRDAILSIADDLKVNNMSRYRRQDGTGWYYSDKYFTRTFQVTLDGFFGYDRDIVLSCSLGESTALPLAPSSMVPKMADDRKTYDLTVLFLSEPGLLWFNYFGDGELACLHRNNTLFEVKGNDLDPNTGSFTYMLDANDCFVLEDKKNNLEVRVPKKMNLIHLVEYAMKKIKGEI